MSKSTIETILHALQSTAHEKKEKLNESCKEKSVWLKNEFEVIRKLIQQNPRDACLEKRQSEVLSTDIVASIASSSAGRRESSLDGKKRKSPETVNAIKLSPQLKRTSVDVEDILSQVGLPADLNKMTKEQLLNELKKFGCTNFTHKQLKKELVDGLRDAVLADHHKKAPPPPTEEATSTIEDVNPVATVDTQSHSTAMDLATPSKPAPARKGSLMADFRSIVHAQATPAQSAAPAIEDEFLARQNRHRESVAARKSVLIVPETVAAAVPAAATVETPPECNNTTEIAVAPTIDTSNTVSEAVAPATASKVAYSNTARDCIYPEDGVWMEVSSPAKPAPEETTAAPVEEDDEKTVHLAMSPEVEVAAAVKSSPVGATPQAQVQGDDSSSSKETRQRTESDASFVSCLSTASVPKASTTSSTTTGSTRPAASTVEVKTESAKAHTSSSTSTTTATKPSVQPSIQKAKMTVKPTTSTTSSNSSSTDTAFKRKEPLPGQSSLKSAHASSASSHSRPATTTTTHPTTTASTASTAPAAKKGIFGFLNPTKKPTTQTATSAAAPTAAPTSAPSTVVDSIINSAKADVKTTPPTTSAPQPSTTTPTVSTPKAAPAVALNNAFASKSLLSNIVQNYNNALKTGNNSVHGGSSTPIAAASVPAATASVLRDITTTTNATPASVKTQPVAATFTSTPAAAVIAAPVQEYVIEDRDSSDESGTDGEGDPEEAKKKLASVPDWARGPMLKEALERQFGLHGQPPADPDSIFTEVTTCSLEEIFGLREGRNNKKYSARSSSAHWDADQMTLVEKRSYRKHMGYDRAATVGGALAK